MSLIHLFNQHKQSTFLGFKRLVPVTIISLFCLLMGQALQAQTNGRITVTTTNQETGEAITGQKVKVLRHVNETEDMQLVAGGVTNKKGQYTFKGLPVDGAHYVVSTQYHDIQYTTEHIPIEVGSEKHEVPLHVYNTTTDESAIVLEALHLIVVAQEGLLKITEILIFKNSGQTTFVPDSKEAGLQLALPQHAVGTQYMSDGIEDTPQGLRYTQPIPPGTAQVIYAYSLDLQTINRRLSEPLAYDTHHVQVLVTPSNQMVTGAHFVQEGMRQLGGKSYLLLTNKEALKRGMALELDFQEVFAKEDFTRWGVLGLAALIAVVGVIIGLKSRKDTPSKNGDPAPVIEAPTPRLSEISETPSPQLQQASEDQETSDSEYTALLYAMADLDDLFEVGEIDERVYKKKRKKLQSQALELIPDV